MTSAWKASAVAIPLAICVIGFGQRDQAGWGVAAAEDPHAYFNALVRRSDHWKSYSLRDQSQLGSRGDVTYDPSSDKDLHRQDAAKVVIPAFFDTTSLTQSVSATATVLTLETAYKPSFPRNRVIKVGNEIMTVTSWLSDTTISVTRGTHGTTPAAHAVGAALMRSTNSLRSQVRLPLGTEDGHDYFFVWDSYWTDSFVNAGRFNHKAFQFSSGSRDGDAIWFEQQASYGRAGPPCDDAVAALGVRYYNKPGGEANWSLTDGNMLGPGAGPKATFCVEPNTWVRYFVRIRQRANDYDPVDVWVADERHEAVQVVTNAQVSVRPSGPTPNSIAKFWIEFNSSEDDLNRVDGRDLVAYVRNFAALRDAGDPRSLLVKPVGGIAPRAGLTSPRNIRIVR